MAGSHVEPDFYDHLEVLRRTILLALALFLTAAVAAFVFADPLLEIVKRPADLLRLPLYFLRPQEKFLTYVRIAFSAALVVTLPLSLLLAARFLAPALTARERRLLFPAVGSMLILFAAGLLFAYFVVVPIALAFFANFHSADGIQPLWSFGEYVRTLVTLLLAFCLVFESPFALLLLLRTGVLRIDTLRRYRRHAMLVILLLSALVTPPDVVSQALVAVPLYLLYESTILIARLLPSRGRTNNDMEVDPWIDESS